VQDAATLALLAGQLGLGPARLAGVGPATGRADSSASPPPPETRPPPPPQRPARQPQTAADGAPGTPQAPTGGPPSPAAQATLVSLPPLQATAGRPAWLADDTPALRRGELRAPASPDPLFPPATTRALGAAVAAVRSADGEVDVDRLVTALAGRERLQALPRQPAWTLRRGLQVLVDSGAGMAPFEADVQQLLAVLGRVVGRDRLQVQAFDGEPLRGGWPVDDGAGSEPAPVDAPAGWRPPAPGVPVLVLSDFGIARPPGALPLRPSAWRGFADAAAQRGHPLRALLPYAASRWPAGLPRPFTLLAWDRRTTVAGVRRLLAG
jgi:hypothetical protein